MGIKYFDASGAEVSETQALDHRGIIRDGFRMRAPMLLRDSASGSFSPSRPVADTDDSKRDPFRPLTDDEKVARIDRFNDRLSNAWRNPGPARPQLDIGSELAAIERSMHLTKDGVPDMDAIYDRHDKRLENAWRS